MAVAENVAIERTTRSPLQQLAVSSLLGGALLVVAFIGFFGLFPIFWSNVLGLGDPKVLNPFLSSTLLFLFSILVGVGLIYGLLKLEAQHRMPGLRAGSILGGLVMFLVLALVVNIGNYMETREGMETFGVLLTLVLGLALLGGLGWVYFRPGFGKWLQKTEERGWFHATGYKASQGQRVRRGTLLALLVIGLTGIYAFAGRSALGTAADEWFWWIPFTGNESRDTKLYLPIMYHVGTILPLLLIAAVCWIAWRLVNWPTFADFLIATDAEMNKVSWTTRKRLVTDTIVVLVTTILLTAFLFFLDVLWIKVLGSDLISVLKVNVAEEFRKQQEKTLW
ncbi:MAG: preprotein translocase subunit SecE [Gemmataceae bacterium]|nr:preprotein translocase subunit SecE [Gemmataceae bacterium]